MLIKLGNPVIKIPPRSFAEKYSEKHLEDILEKDTQAFLGFDVLLIGRQVKIEQGIVDLLAVDKDGNIIIIELKRGDAHREIQSQANSYRAYFKHKVTSEDQINRWAEEYYGQTSDENLLIRRKMKEKFGAIPPKFNREQVVVLIAETFDDGLLQQLDLLRSICIEFSYYAGDDEEYIVTKKRHDTSMSMRTESEDQKKKSVRMHTHDEFLKTVADLVREAVPQNLKGFRNTSSGTPKGQWMRYHWRTTDVCIILAYWENAMYVQLYNWKRDPKVTDIVKKHQREIMRRLGVKEAEFHLNEKRLHVDKRVCEMVGNTDTNAAEEVCAKEVVNFLQTLKPLLGDLL